MLFHQRKSARSAGDIGVSFVQYSLGTLACYSPADYADHAEGMQQAVLFRRERQVVVRLFMGNCVNLHKIKIEIMTENEISFKIRGAIFKVYDELGPGLLESIYEAALCYQMQKDGLKVENQTKLDVYYDNHLLPLDYRLDILVEDKVIIELKSVDEVTPVHFKQLLTYLKLANKHLGILVNFNADNIIKAIYRKVNNI